LTTNFREQGIALLLNGTLTTNFREQGIALLLNGTLTTNFREQGIALLLNGTFDNKFQRTIKFINREQGRDSEILKGSRAPGRPSDLLEYTIMYIMYISDTTPPVTISLQKFQTIINTALECDTHQFGNQNLYIKSYMYLESCITK